MELADVRCLAVLGLRRSGRPAALLARRELPAARVVALDEGARAGRRHGAGARGRRRRGPDRPGGPAARRTPGCWSRAPACRTRAPRCRRPCAAASPLWSEVEFACRFLPNPVVGITGTNGKTTTTELTGAILRDARLPVAVGGNIGHALAAMPGEVDPGRDRRGRALQLPARAHRALPAGRGRAPQPHRGPPRPARHLPRLRGRQAAHLREPGARRRRAALRRRRRDPRRAGRRPPRRARPARLVLRRARTGPKDPAGRSCSPASAPTTCSGCASTASSGGCAAATSSRCAATTTC